MYRQLAGAPQLPRGGSSIPDIARSGQLDALIALERIGTRLRFSRNQEIYGQGESGGFWYKVISGTVRNKQAADRWTSAYCRILLQRRRVRSRERRGAQLFGRSG